MINRAVITGRLTKDVEVRKTQSGRSVASFTVACDRNRHSQDPNQQSADFINCVAWQQSADFLGQYARKGAMIAVDGRIQTRSYQNNQGATVYVTEIVADNVQLLESRAQSEARMQNSSSYSQNGYGGNSYGGNSYGSSNGYQNSYQQPSYSQPSQQGSAGQSSSDGNGGYDSNSSLNISDDDLPF